ncbi:MAG: biotin synthase BioB [Nitrospirae bacterium]|nr:biotin synthase BioB [Nitrospirota bacterium]
MLKALFERILSGGFLSKEEAIAISETDGDIFELFLYANKITKAFRGDSVDLCSIVNAKSGACPEDCSYCAQSAKAKTELESYPLISKDVVIEKARKAKTSGAKRFCIVISGKRATPTELKEIALMIASVRGIGLLPCATLGLLKEDELRTLKSAGLERYHHNLETSRRFFPEICKTHSYEEKLMTIRAVKSAGLSLCSGGIFGIGEDWQDRVEMAVLLRELDADSIPINFLIPIPGTACEHVEPIPPFEALKIISLYRFLLPQKEIRLCGGRHCLGEFNSFAFMAGADGLLIGDYLTTTGRKIEDDLKLIKHYGLKNP